MGQKKNSKFNLMALFYFHNGPFNSFRCGSKHMGQSRQCSGAKRQLPPHLTPPTPITISPSRCQLKLYCT